MTPKLSSVNQLLFFAGAVGVLYVVFRGRKLLTEDLNPASRENLVTRAVRGEDKTVTLFDKPFAYLQLAFGDEETQRRAEAFLGESQRAAQ